MEDNEVDLLYIEVVTDNQEFCGQSSIPLSSLRRGSLSLECKACIRRFDVLRLL